MLGPTSGAAFAQSVTIDAPYPGEATVLTGAGSTLAAPLYEKWFDEYADLVHVDINYQAIDSGGGIQGLQDETIDFGASDVPMTDDQLRAAKGGPIFHIPTALAAIVPIYNVPDIGNTPLNLTADDLAGVYLGTISAWNDPKLVADNPSLASVNQPIVVVHRSDASGTTYAFTEYLSAVSPDWQSQVGRATSVAWPVGLGDSGSLGVSGEVQQDPYAIGYVELMYALQNHLRYASVMNSSGTFVNASQAGVEAAASAAVAGIPADLRFSLVNEPGPNTYPISTATWLLVYQNMTDRTRGLALTRMLWWATHDGQPETTNLAYAPIPPEITHKSEAFIRQINVNGQPIFPGQ